MIQQRCMFIEGIGRCHVIGSDDEFDVAPMDHGPFEVALGIRAADIIAGTAPGRILWSVRFKEKGRNE